MKGRAPASSFTKKTSLKVNFHKSCLIPINVPAHKVPLLTEAFGCIEGKLPFTYLGIPLGTTKPLVKDFAPLVCRIERKLLASSMYLNYAGRLQSLTQLSLQSQPIICVHSSCQKR